MTELAQSPRRWPLFLSIRSFATATLPFHTTTATNANGGRALTIRIGSALSTKTVRRTDTRRQAATMECQKGAAYQRAVAVGLQLDIVRTLILTMSGVKR